MMMTTMEYVLTKSISSNSISWTIELAKSYNIKLWTKQQSTIHTESKHSINQKKRIDGMKTRKIRGPRSKRIEWMCICIVEKTIENVTVINYIYYGSMMNEMSEIWRTENSKKIKHTIDIFACGNPLTKSLNGIGFDIFLFVIVDWHNKLLLSWAEDILTDRSRMDNWSEFAANGCFSSQSLTIWLFTRATHDPLIIHLCCSW